MTKIVKKDVGMPASGEFRRYRRRNPFTDVAGPYDPPVEIHTPGGVITVADKQTYIAVDSEGHPYPIDPQVLESTFEPEPPGPHVAPEPEAA